MTQYDAIIVGAGHNGLAAGVLLQEAGLRTAILEAKRYAGGMASTVELFDGFHFEIAGSLQFPTSAVVSEALGLGNLPTVELEVMSVSTRGIGDTPLVYYTDLLQLMSHLEADHGSEVVMGMADLAAWAAAPTRAMGRFDVMTPPRTAEEMLAMAADDAERRAIQEMLTASASDVIDRFIPDKEKHGALRGMLAFLACNSQYRGPETPGSAYGFAFGFAVPDESATLMTKLEGGIGTLTRHLQKRYADAGGELHLDTAVTGITAAGDRVTGVSTDRGSFAAPAVVSSLEPGLTVGLAGSAAPEEVRARVEAVDHRGSYVQMHFALDGVPEFAAPYELLNDPKMQGAIGLFNTPEELQQQYEDCRRGIVPADPAVAFQIPSAQDPTLAPPGKAAASAYSLWFPIEGSAAEPHEYARLKAEMGQRVIDKICRIAPTFERLILKHTTFTPKHMSTMFGAPGGDWAQGLIHPEQMGEHRPGPSGWRDLPLGIDGLYLGGAGCHGGPGITFIPGYNAAQAVLADRSATG